MGFQHMLPVVRRAAQKKGGDVRKPKGLALLPEQRRKEIASMGGKTKNDNSSRKVRKKQESPSDNRANLADLPRELIYEPIQDTEGDGNNG